MPAAPDLSALDRHERIACGWSGGKDSTAALYLLRPHLHRITVYHVDTGDLLPEVLEVVEAVRPMIPNLVEIRTDPRAWQQRHGLPTDLLPHSAHSIGQRMGEATVRLVPRYECCAHNLMLPFVERVKADGNTLLIRGTKAADMARLPAKSGDVGDGLELLLPLQDWSHADVFDYLRAEGAPVARFYGPDGFTNAPECARCPAWWSERRAAYLRQHHPALHMEYVAALVAITEHVAPIAQHLKRELEA